MKNIHFHCLTLENPALLKIWLVKLKLKNSPVNANEKVCSAHFNSGGYLCDLGNELITARPKCHLKKTIQFQLFLTAVIVVGLHPQHSNYVL